MSKKSVGIQHDNVIFFCDEQVQRKVAEIPAEVPWWHIEEQLKSAPLQVCEVCEDKTHKTKAGKCASCFQQEQIDKLRKTRERFRAQLDIAEYDLKELEASKDCLDPVEYQENKKLFKRRIREAKAMLKQLATRGETC